MLVRSFTQFAGQVHVSADDANVPVVDPTALLVGVVSLVSALAGIICVIIIVIAGLRYVTSQGDSGAVTKAKNAILYAVIGLAVSLSAFSIVRFVSDGVLGR